MRIEGRGVSLRRIWASRILTALSVLFLLMDGGMKLFKPPLVIESTSRLGYPESTIVGIGVTLLVCTVLYLIPRTAVPGGRFCSLATSAGRLRVMCAPVLRSSTWSFPCCSVLWRGLHWSSGTNVWNPFS